MILDQLIEYRPEFGKRAMPRSLSQAYRRQQKIVRRKTIRTYRKTVAVIRRQYYLTNALIDTKRAAKNNEDILIGSLLLATTISFSLASTLANLVYIFMQTAAALSTVSGVSLALLALVAAGVIVTLTIWVLTFLQNMLSLSVMEGATGKRIRSTRMTIRKSLGLTTRVSSAWVLLGIIALGPVGTIALMTLIVLHAIHVPLASSLPFLAVIGVLALGWIIGILVRFGLTPQVALFEPTLSWSQVYSRSQQLLQHKGKLFILSGYVALLGGLAATYGVALLLQWATHVASTLTFIILAWYILTLANTTAVMFYRKRKLARK